MKSIQTYLLAVVCCGFLTAMLQNMITKPSVKRIVRLASGCFLCLVVLSPLAQVDFSQLKDYFSGLELSAQTQAEQAAEKNAQIFASLVEEQTAQAVAEKAEALGTTASAEVRARAETEGGYPVPYSITVHTVCTGQTRRDLENYITQELNIPASRQRWVIQ